jgi:hypothetical protein
MDRQSRIEQIGGLSYPRKNGWIRQDPRDLFSAIFNREEWYKLVEQEPQRRRKFMQQVIDSRFSRMKK